jgi:uncharacterized protein (TIGR02231 family)
MSARTIELPVSEVTLLEDRAQVVRSGKVALKAGPNMLRIEGVAPVLVDKTLAGRLDEGSKAELVDLKVKRRRLVQESDRPEEVAELQRLARELKVEGARLEREQALVTGHVKGLARAADQAVAELAVDASWGRVDPGGWEARFGLLHDSEAVQRRRGVELAWELSRLELRKRDLVRRRRAVEGVSSVHRADLLVQVTADEPGEVELRIEYLAPGACWRPWHRATLTDGALAFRCDGCVWQATGEDWNDVRLLFSTERASLGVEPPELEADELHTRRIGPAVQVETREQEIHTTGLGGGGTTTTPEMPGIADGGEPRRLAAMARATVPSDGRPHRFPAFDFGSPATEELLLAAELVPAVVLRTEHDNGAVLPILPGPVDLVRESGLVGRTFVDFVAPGERFELGWGPDLALRVHREHERAHLDSKLFSSWSAVRHEVSVRVSNIGPDARTVQVTERLPVSELDKVKIEKKGADPAVEPDRDGFAKWTLRVPGYGRDEVKLEYEVSQHPDVQGLSI